MNKVVSGSVEGVWIRFCAVRQVTEKVIEKDKVVYAAFVDLEKAYDSVSRSKLWVALKDYGVKGKLLAAVQSLYEEGWARVRVAGKESCPFQVWKGVRQGCPLSPWLFNIFIRPVHTVPVMRIRCAFDADSSVHTLMRIGVDAHSNSHP